MTVTAVDLFCGVGGLTHGLQLAGLPVIAGFDIENSCRFAYEHNNNSRFILRDITQLRTLFKNPCSQAELNKIVPFGFSLQRQKNGVFFAIKIV